MKSFARVIISAVFFALIIGTSAMAQTAKLQIDQLDRLFPKAVETIDVRIDGGLLQMASKFLNGKGADEQAVRELVSKLKGVYVKGVEFDKAGEFAESDVQMVRNQLSAPGWSRIVGVTSKRDKENVEVFMMLEGDVISGIGVLITDPKQIMVVNVVGPIEPEKIGQLRGSFGIPGNLDLNWNGAKREKRN
ncbi:MAG: DUF4252 domain-containing protein [Acidobacteria bacterium]|jgi:hypothetical protein|nr:DUF4252 domain-containing protein [Acidobacteriota bacterium]MBK7599995.1 DUF4252 domain-containing protein [Acidobacteriota bacterium]MBK8315763.1 DUF4252 domain-containing protein [Acidobacteriota bacterium]MBK9707214.1 DUF4252 domain-containing protein [Acidobacteriota bacterium]